MATITEFIKKKRAEPSETVFRLRFDASSSVPERVLSLPGILDWIEESNFEHPLLMVLENYSLYCKEFAADLLGRANMANCAVILTTQGSDPRAGVIPQIEPGVFEKCATILDLNRRRAGIDKDAG